MHDDEFYELDKLLLEQHSKIIHQVWFGNIPNKKKASIEYERLKKYRDSWSEKNPDWFRMEWDLEKSETLVRLFYPEHLEMYKFYPYQIQRCDMVRYCFLHRYGGLYADMDFFCNKPFSQVLDLYPNNFYLVQTPNMPGEFVSNSLMYSKNKEHIFWRTLLIEMQHSKNTPVYFNRHLTIMYASGPGIVNRVYQKYKNKYKLASYPHKYFQPFGQADDIMSLKVPHAFTIHASTGSWHTNDSSIIVILSRNWVIFLYVICGLIIINLIYAIINKYI